ncbi:MAG TPA: dienelactone hydrolase family protein [Afifellaceae bacterium]|nr:dienelactone hydrolase family protein [Afifellaceae bacterium]
MFKVNFPVRNPVLVSDLAQGSAGAPTIQTEGYLALPPGARQPVPAVVIMEGLGGLIQSREFAYARKLAGRGYAALVVDSFGSRGAAHLSHPKRALKVTESMILGDAFGALQFLARHPRIDASRIFVMGFSYGGMISVLTAYENLRRLYVEGSPRFAGHVSYYGCSVPRLAEPEATGAPVLMMLGELDRNVCPERSQAIAADLRACGTRADVIVYEDTYHQWDGEDEERRFVPFSLHRCRFVMEPGYSVRCETTGLRMRGLASRAAMIAAGVGYGYHILRAPEVTERSDAELFGFLERHSALPGQAPAMPHRAAAAAAR